MLYDTRIILGFRFSPLLKKEKVPEAQSYNFIWSTAIHSFTNISTYYVYKDCVSFQKYMHISFCLKFN